MVNLNFKDSPVIIVDMPEPTDFSLQIVSDLHLEYRKTLPDIVPSAPYLALCGDIGHPKKPLFRQLLNELSPKFKQIFLIAGNHEYYNKKLSYDKINTIMSRIAMSYPNVSFLNNMSTDVGNYRILGTTLWTKIPDELADYVTKQMNDYRSIMYYDKTTHSHKPITVGHTNKWNNENVVWLKHELAQAKLDDKKVIVLSHHAPIANNTIAPKFEHDRLNVAYVNNLNELLTEPIVLWAYGHTHYATNFDVNGVKIVSNPLGYPAQTCGFNTSLVIDVTSVINSSS